MIVLFFWRPRAARAHTTSAARPGFALQVLGRVARPVGFPLQSVAGLYRYCTYPTNLGE